MADYAVALSTPATLAAPPKVSLDVAEALIREVEAADVIVIGTPMHNFTIPSVLEAWIDQTLRDGRTMKSTPAGKVGMLRDRPVLSASLPAASLPVTEQTNPIFLRRICSRHSARSG
ncbi:NAD(P)H-dependent oxidoreductase [Sinorhizobium psoraleae]|uniref:NAD(P)H-dependent oxidoreductase n=1 Tax=Sinorhizobium psoraleae TaxID=520838 RepID=UPI00289C5DDE|nr:NAD(P)H-dependent oxidoreductase [Sinorhizobium psoraleae]